MLEKKKKKNYSKILITGSNGFIGRNLATRLSEEKIFSINFYNRSDCINQLEKLVSEADLVIHLAGENRPKSSMEFEKTNVGLTKKICDLIRLEAKDANRLVPLIFTSSIHAKTDSAYGKSKREAENKIRELNAEIGNSCCIYRLPGVFGKWSRPNYNSVVATFCYNIARNLSVDIHDPNQTLDLGYIDDVVNDILSLIFNGWEHCEMRDLKPLYKVKLNKIYNLLCKFQDLKLSNRVGNVGKGFERALYSTFLSFQREVNFSYKLKSHIDGRGAFVEILKTNNSGQFSFFTAKPGATRGEHYHHTKTEKFLVVKGTASFRFRNLLDDNTIELKVSDEVPEIVDTIPGWVHEITNIGREELIVMLWANEIFDPKRPDTISAKV